jgi:ABC-type dipeptide/oligopeptide/nickel transport system permease subunit
MQRLRHDRAAMISLAVIIVIAVVAIFAPVVAAITGHGVYQQFRGPQPPVGLSATGQPVGPSPAFLLGTDDQGRDILVRVAYGARISLFVGVVATALTVTIGTVVGLAAGYFGKIVDTVLARLMDWLLAVPFLLLAISLASVTMVHPIGPLGPGLPIVIFVLGVLTWASVGRIVRGQVLSIREKEYIQAARALGAGPWRIMVIDILPNLLAQLIVYTTLLIPLTIVGEASLSFLGVGVLPPTADWGQMIGDGARVYLYGQWWFLLFPSLALLITTLAFNIFGDGVRDAFDPRADVFV